MSETPRFEDLFDLDDIQRLQDQFAAATEIASIITRPDGTPITTPSNFQRLCADIVRKTEIGLENCRRSDLEIGKPSIDGPTVRVCLSCGLWDAGAAITVGGVHIASWLVGQVRDETMGEESIRAYAEEIGADVEESVGAFREIPIMPRERFEKIAEAVFTLANQLSDSAYRNLQMTRSITQREATADELRQSRTLYRTLIDTIPDLIWLKDRDGLYISCNSTFEKFFGAREEEIIGKTDYDFVDEELADFFRENDRKAVEADGPRMNEEWLTFAEGGHHGLFETIKTPMRNADGDLIGILGIARDVTQREKTERELRESEERFRSLHNASFGGIAIHDKGVILECNQGMAAMTGFSVEELIGMDGLQLIAEGSREFVMQKIASGFEHPYEAVGRRKDGTEYPVRIEGKNVPYKGRQVRTVEFRDITEIKRAEDEHRQLQDRLNQAQKMESVGQLAGGVAHDFNNLLQVILGFGEIALDSSPPNGPVNDSLVQMMKAGERARTLVTQLLAFSRRQVLDMKNLDLNDVISDMLKILRRVIGEHIDLRFVPGAELGGVRADSGQLGQILTNLCVNARDAMPGGGTVTIETGNVNVGRDDREIHFWVEAGDYVRMKVSDTGNGIDPATLDQVFEPFFTTKDVGEGTGLGLSTVYGLVKQHDGSVHVTSAEGRGTTFHIYLPRSAQGKTIRTARPTEAVHGGTETILLAEDDEMVRHLTSTLLERSGYTVLRAEDGVEALDVFEKHADEIDLLLLDVIMPRMNGRAVFDRIRQVRPGMPALFASGYSMDAVHTDFILDEGLVLVQKPVERDELLRKVREVLDAP